MNTLITVLVVALLSFAMILGVIYLDKMTKKSKEIIPIEHPEVLKPTIPTGSLKPQPKVVEILEPLKETIAPAPKPKKRYKHNKPKPKQ